MKNLISKTNRNILLVFLSCFLTMAAICYTCGDKFNKEEIPEAFTPGENTLEEIFADNSLLGIRNTD